MTTSERAAAREAIAATGDGAGFTDYHARRLSVIACAALPAALDALEKAEAESISKDAEIADLRVEVERLRKALMPFSNRWRSLPGWMREAAKKNGNLTVDGLKLTAADALHFEQADAALSPAQPKFTVDQMRAALERDTFLHFKARGGLTEEGERRLAEVETAVQPKPGEPT